MRERPILFSAPMVRAILDGRKTVTRRVVKPQPWASCCIEEGMDGEPPFVYSALGGDGPGYDVTETRTPCRCPYGVRGDRLYVRETWAAPHAYDHLPPRLIPQDARIHYAATEDRGGLLWRPSIHMPRWASRITLEVTGVLVERLQEISYEDARAEGAEFWRNDGTLTELPPCSEHRYAFEDLWTSINGADSWNANPFVWVVTFRRIDHA